METMPRILAVDDSSSMRQMVTFTLKRAGFDVLQAVDGVDALGVAQKEQVDLVLTDINMPNMDGFQLIRELRAMSSYRYTPILTLTTESTPEKKAIGREAGATGWIVKPFDPERLVATIHQVIG
ncbi:MAG: response regulator [Thiotrichales bacterium]